MKSLLKFPLLVAVATMMSCSFSACSDNDDPCLLYTSHPCNNRKIIDLIMKVSRIAAGKLHTPQVIDVHVREIRDVYKRQVYSGTIVSYFFVSEIGKGK